MSKHMLLALSLAACTVNGKPLFGFGTSSGAPGPGPTPIANHASPPALAKQSAQQQEAPPTDEEKENPDWRLKRACPDYEPKCKAAYYSRLVEGLDAFIDFDAELGEYYRLDANNIESAGKYNSAMLVEKGKQCFAANAAAEAKDVHATHVILAKSHDTPFADFKAACERIATAGKDYDKKVADAKQRIAEAEKNRLEREAENAAEVKAMTALMSGDKLEFVLKERGYISTLRQGKLESPKDYARASVFFMALENSDKTWTLRRYEFKGNKLASETEEGFLVRPGPNAYR